ncbi:MAG: prephenate dehydratase [Firmicutes bacterium]|nr:prephenate dehydratase [Bacillota bacterium]
MEDIKRRSEEIDKEIQKLYKERMKLSNMTMELADLGDVKSIVETALKNTPEVFPDCALVACQGVPGSYSQAAAKQLFNHPDINFYKNFEDVFLAIERGECEYGVLPIENSTAGSVNKIYDLLIYHRCYIVRSTRLKINHNLMAHAGSKRNKIQRIYSHEQALNQCEGYLKGFDDVEVLTCSNTAKAAKIAAEDETGTTAAICSSSCAEIYDLDILDRAIQDNNNNYTKFICISKTPQIFPGADITSIMAKISHKPGSLFEVMKIFAEKGYNLTKLESRPVPDTAFEFMFYFDFDAPIVHEGFVDAIMEMSLHCEDLEYLGSYTERI